MSIPRTVAEVLREHVTLEVEGIDRMYLNVYVPALQRAGGVASFFRFHRGHQFASSVLMDPITKAFIAQMEQFAKQEKVPIAAEMVPPVAAPIYGERSTGRVPVSDLDSASRVLADPGPGSSGHRSGILRGGDSGKPGHRTAEPSAVDLRSSGESPDTW